MGQRSLIGRGPLLSGTCWCGRQSTRAAATTQHGWRERTVLSPDGRWMGFSGGAQLKRRPSPEARRSCCVRSLGPHYEVRAGDQRTLMSLLTVTQRSDSSAAAAGIHPKVLMKPDAAKRGWTTGFHLYCRTAAASIHHRYRPAGRCTGRGARSENGTTQTVDPKRQRREICRQRSPRVCRRRHGARGALRPRDAGGVERSFPSRGPSDDTSEWCENFAVSKNGTLIMSRAAQTGRSGRRGPSSG